MRIARTLAAPHAVAASIAGDFLLIGEPPVVRVVALRTGKPVGTLPPDATVGARAGTHAIVETAFRDGAWTVERWNLATCKRVATLATCRPDDRIGNVVLVGDRTFAIHARARTWQLVELGGELAVTLATTVVPFHLAVAATTAAWVYFTGKGGLVDLATGTQRPLTGGTLRIGRQHHLGIGPIAFDATGRYLQGVSSGIAQLCVWDATTGKTVAGPWRATGAVRASFAGDRLCWSMPSGELRTAAIGSAEVTTVPAAHPVAVVPIDDRRVATATDRRIDVWDLVTGAHLDKLALDDTVALAVGGGRLVARSKGGTLTVVELATTAAPRGKLAAARPRARG